MQEPKQQIHKKQSLAWGPAAAFWVSVGAYLVSQLAVIIPLLLGKLIGGDGANTPWFEFILTGVSASALLLTLWLFLKNRKQSFAALGFKKPQWSDLGWLVVAVIVYGFLLWISFAVASLIPSFNADQVQDIGFDNVAGWQIGLVFISLVVLPPLAEEMLFRGFMYRGLVQKWKKVWAALLVSALFGLVHFQWNVALDVFMLSIVAIALLEVTKNLWTCIALHALKNGAAFVALFLLT